MYICVYLSIYIYIYTHTYIHIHIIINNTFIYIYIYSLRRGRRHAAGELQEGPDRSQKLLTLIGHRSAKTND